MEAVENYMKMVQGALRAPGNNYRHEMDLPQRQEG